MAEALPGDGVSIGVVLKRLGVSRSAFSYRQGQAEMVDSKTPPHGLLHREEEKIAALKSREPHLSYRQISELLCKDNVWMSPSSCYRTLKSQAWWEEWSLREAPWKTPRYEPFHFNEIGV